MRPQQRRNGPDNWPTPSCLAEALIRHALPHIPSGVVWECAAGSKGALVQAMRHAGRAVVASDLHGISPGLDFLRDSPPPPRTFSAIITNPPFCLLDPFIVRGLALLDGGLTKSLVLLMRDDALSAARRVDALNRAHSIIGCCWRPRWIANTTTSPRWNFSWVVWRADKDGPPTVLRVLR